MLTVSGVAVPKVPPGGLDFQLLGGDPIHSPGAP